MQPHTTRFPINEAAETSNENNSQNHSRFDVFPRTDRIYCYICGETTTLERTSGDQDRVRLQSQDVADAGLYSTSDIDIEPVTCLKSSCRLTFESLPASKLHKYKIPYIETTVSDRVPFANIPHCYDSRFVSGEEIFKHIREYSRRQLEAFFQVWLFFGLLHEFLGDFYQRDDYIRTDEMGAKFLSRNRLATTLAGWMHSLPTSGDDAEQLLLRLTKVLNDCQKMLFALKFYDFGADLREFLASTAENFAWALGILFPKKPINKSFPQCGDALKIDSLTAFGWCPHEAQKASITVSTLALKALYQHSDRRGREGSHKSCLPANCVSSEEVYASDGGLTHHVGCLRQKCKPVVVEETCMEMICSILEGDNIPLICAEVDATGSVSLQVVPYAKELPYIAISHVWAQGLGNKADNSLSKCQVERLLGYMRNLWSRSGLQKEHPLLFWLDTFCCPVPSRADRKFRKRAIKLMRKTYERASHVLVIDSELEAMNVLDHSPVEIGLRISVSSWAGRLWTMQEGQLPRDLWFQFQGAALDSHSLWLALRAVRRGSDVKERILANDVLLRLESLRMLCGRYEALENTRQELAMVTRGMQNRATSWEPDEAICISTLFNLDTGRVQEFDSHEQRMKDIWQQLSKRRLIPRSAAFSVGPRLQLTGYTWAHSTFLNNKAALGFQDYSSLTGNATGQGLKITGSGFMVAMATAVEGFEMTDEESRQPRQEVFVVKTLNNRYARFVAMDTIMEQSLQVAASKRNNVWDDLVQPPGTLAFLRKHLTSDPTSRDDGICLLVKVIKREGASIYCKRLHLGSLTALPPGEEASTALAVHHADNLRNHDLCRRFSQLKELLNDEERRSRWHQMYKDLVPLFAFDESLRHVNEIPEDLREIGPDQSFSARVPVALAGRYVVASDDLPEETQWYVD